MKIIGICGASSSGKTTISNNICKSIGNNECLILSLDSFYKPPPDNIDLKNYNFDHPEAFNFELAFSCLKELMETGKTQIPIYSFRTHSVVDFKLIKFNGKLIIFEGILSFHYKKIADLFDLKIFIETDLDLCLLRRIKRDTIERGRDTTSILEQYEKFVRPSLQKFILPSKLNANIIIPNGEVNLKAIDIIRVFIMKE